jgi:hypothetical protein
MKVTIHINQRKADEAQAKKRLGSYIETLTNAIFVVTGCRFWIDYQVHRGGWIIGRSAVNMTERAAPCTGSLHQLLTNMVVIGLPVGHVELDMDNSLFHMNVNRYKDDKGVWHRREDMDNTETPTAPVVQGVTIITGDGVTEGTLHDDDVLSFSREPSEHNWKESDISKIHESQIGSKILAFLAENPSIQYIEWTVRGEDPQYRVIVEKTKP